MPESDSHARVSPDRRAVLQVLGGGAIATLAGCLGDDDGDDGDDSGDGGNPGEPVELEFIVPNFRTYPEEMEFFMNEWERNLGVSINLQTQDWSTHLADVIAGGDFEHIGFTSSGSTPPRVADPQFYLADPVTDEFPNPNQSGYSNEEYDELYEELVQTLDADERDDLIGQLQEITHNELPFLGFGWPPFVSPVNTALWDFQPAQFMGASSFHTMGVIEAEPQTDETTLVMGLSGDIETGNPLGVTETGVSKLLDLIYDTPRMLNYDGEAVDWACTLEEVDETTFELTLHEDLTEFTDGTEVTADDLAFTVEFIAEHTPSLYGAVVTSIESAEAVDDRTAQVNLSRPDHAFTTATLVMLPILPEHIWADVPDQAEEVGAYDMPLEEMVGAGPFQIESWDTEQIRFVANEDYYRGAPGPDEVILVARGSNDALRTDMIRGEIHCLHSLIAPTIADGIASENPEVEVIETESMHFEHLSFNFDNAPINELPLREALTRSIDIETFSETFFLGGFTPGNNTPIHPELSVGRDDLPTLDELYDPDEARSILEEAGYSWDGDDNLLYPEE